MDPLLDDVHRELGSHYACVGDCVHQYAERKKLLKVIQMIRDDERSSSRVYQDGYLKGRNDEKYGLNSSQVMA